MIINENGIQIDTLTDLVAQIEQSYRDIYGSDINLDQNTADGQRVGIEAKLLHDMQQLILKTYSSLDPDFAEGDRLDSIIKLNKIIRDPATQSQADLNLVSTGAFVLQAGFTVKDAFGRLWSTRASYNIEIGSNQVTVFCQEFGAISADPNSITEIATPIGDVASVTNPIAALVGRDEETDEQLRQRRNRTTENPAVSTVRSLEAALLNLPNVTDARVYENATSSPVGSLPANSIWCVVEGGSVADIARAILQGKNAGCGLYANTLIGYNEFDITTAQERPQSGTTFTVTDVMKFNRPSEVPVFIKMTAKRKIPNQPLDLERIKRAIAQKKYFIFDDAVASELYYFAYQAASNFVATDLEISLNNVDFFQQLISGNQEKFVISTDNIDITEVIT